MAIVERRDLKGIVYYVANEWHGRQKSERVGRNRRDAERRDEAMKKEIENDTYQPPGKRAAVSFGEHALAFNAKRTNKTAAKEARLAANHMQPRAWLWEKRLTQVRTPDVDKLIAELRAETNAKGERRLTDKTISDVIQLMRRMFAAAIRAELCDRQPVVLEHGTWDHTAKVREPYTAAEAAVLVRNHKIPWPTRVLIALWTLAGLRQGEGCGLKWKRLDLATRPLACLTIAEQWNGETLKTKRPRVVPVHPDLLEILNSWAETGFELYTGRKPTPEDFVVPEVLRDGVTLRCFQSSASYRCFIRACALVGIQARTLHSCRHTFVTLARRGGARADVLERVSHNARGDMIDRYTHFDWLPLCEAVLCLRLVSPPDPPPLLGNLGEIELPELPTTDDIPEVSQQTAELLAVTPFRLESSNQVSRAQTSKIPPDVQASTQGNHGERWGKSRTAWSRVLLNANRERTAKLLALAEADPSAARPGLAICRAYGATIEGHGEAALAALREAAESLGLTGVRS
jgi:integrase